MAKPIGDLFVRLELADGSSDIILGAAHIVSVSPGETPNTCHVETVSTQGDVLDPTPWVCKGSIDDYARWLADRKKA